MTRPAEFAGRIKASLLALAVSTVGEGGCSIAPSAGRAELAALERGRLDLRTPGGRDITVSFLRAGDPEAPRIVYVHGNPGSAEAWADFLVEPFPGYESIAIDRPGFGQTTPNSSLVEYAEQAAAIEPFLEERRGRRAVIVGHSMGGPLAARAAADHPDSVGALILIAGALDPDLEKPRYYNHVGDLFFVRPFLARPLRNTNDEIFAAPDEAAKLAAILDRVTCPVLIIHGTEDRLVPFENVAYMQDAFTSAERVETVVREGKTHFLLWDDTEATREAMLSFLGTLKHD
jgi:pimeloyl-ACP methyl ester carboxylesterase